MKYPGSFILIFLISLSLNAQWTENGNGTNITTTDNVGIGTTNPGAKLQVHINGNERAFRIVNDANNAQFNFWSTETGAGKQLRIDEDTSGKNLMTLLQNGNVGIGTTNPIYGTVQVKGGATHQLLALNRPNNDVPALYLGNDGTNNAAIASNNSNLTFGRDLSGNYTEYMRIQNTGNVGIGTDNPDAKLAVNGDIHTQEVKVDLIGWPDYVFKKQYELPTLEEVEDHIKQKGHLKDIPSAQEVLENGIFLGDMNAKLLLKIEELTLYTIQQQKEIQSLKKENGELKSISTRLTEIEKLIKLKN